jgi:hypothetical protein
MISLLRGEYFMREGNPLLFNDKKMNTRGIVVKPVVS